MDVHSPCRGNSVWLKPDRNSLDFHIFHVTRLTGADVRLLVGRHLGILSDFRMSSSLPLLLSTSGSGSRSVAVEVREWISAGHELVTTGGGLPNFALLQHISPFQQSWLRRWHKFWGHVSRVAAAWAFLCWLRFLFNHLPMWWIIRVSLHLCRYRTFCQQKITQSLVSFWQTTSY